MSELRNCSGDDLRTFPFLEPCALLVYSIRSTVQCGGERAFEV